MESTSGRRKSSTGISRIGRARSPAWPPWPEGSISPAERLVSDATTVRGSDASDDGEQPNTKPPAGLRKHLTTLWSRRKSQQQDGDTADEDSRGPLGLRLLHASPEPLVDLVFVHGLRGGSIKTWRKGDDFRLFWPKFFLPTDPGFRNASIHSFGYDSDWGSSKQSILNVHDFGNSLLESMRTSPYIRGHAKNPIILIGHSMGGLVIKKAYISARELKGDAQFAGRIQAVFFLATPHRGSDYAATLSNILKMSGFMSSKEYVSELMTGSPSIEMINLDFCKYANDLQIFSFFETLRMSLGGVASALIVNKASAILGPEFETERVQYLAANHRDICKFDGLDDPNYLLVRDSLSTALETLLQKPLSDKAKVSKAQLATLREYLGVPSSPGDHHPPRVEGSCSWIEHRDDFQHWLMGEKTSPCFYVMTAQPGAGKTVLAAHVISVLNDLNLSCAHHFFNARNDDNQSLASLLRSIAYQMASTTQAFREVLLRRHQDDSTFALHDARAIWVQVFKEGLFRCQSLNPQYWIIDGLDECPKYREIFTFLRGEDPSFPLRIMITSRAIPDLKRLLRLLDPKVVPIEIPQSETLNDIQAYIKSRADALPVDTDRERVELSERILAKSDACFLWVRLVLDELENVYGFESVMEILQGIPEGMVAYYKRAIHLVRSHRESEQHIAKAVLRWTVVGARPLHTSELAEALQLESKETRVRQSVKSAVEGLCSYLVQVTSNDMVQLVHLTAREFLLSEDAEEFRVLRPAAHERIAFICLSLLSAPSFRPPKHRLSLNHRRPQPSPLLEYAATNFSLHVYSASSEADKLLTALNAFFSMNALSWIEHIARKGNLHDLLKTARNLRGYLDRHGKYEAPGNMLIKAISDWSVDMARLVTRFGNALQSSPSSIYFLIPPMAPTTSMLYAQVGKTPDGIILAGYDNVAWDDCLATVGLDGDITSALACGQNSIAVGFGSGDAVLYHHQSFQKQGIVRHGSFVERLHFDRTGKLLATTSRKRLAVWDLSGSLQWEYPLTRSVILLASSTTAIVALTTNGDFLRWDSTDGTLLGVHTFTYQPPPDLEQLPGEGPARWGLMNKPPSLAALSPDMEILSIAYMAQPICLWFCQTNDFLGWAVDDRGGHPVTIIFNPNPEIGKFLVAYRDCHLALFDSYSGSQMLCTEGDHVRQVGLLSSTISLDGRTVACVDRNGLLSIRDFETLSLLYYVSSPESMSRQLQFSLDSSSIVDVGGNTMRVWSPSALNRNSNDEGSSVSDDAIELPAVEGRFEAVRASRLVTLCAHPTHRVILAGKQGGEVVAYSSVTGKPIGVLFAHPKGTSVTALAIGTDKVTTMLASGDTYGNVLVCELDSGGVNGKERLRVKVRKAVRTLIFLSGLDRLLVSSADLDCVYSLADGTCVGTLDLADRLVGGSSGGIGHSRQWVLEHDDDGLRAGSHNPHPASSQVSGTTPRLFLVENNMLKEFDPDHFPARPAGWSVDVTLDYGVGDGSVEEEVALPLATLQNGVLVLDTRRRRGYTETCVPLVFDLRHLSKNDATGGKPHPDGVGVTAPVARPVPLTTKLAPRVRQIVVPRPDRRRSGDHQMLFLSDANWVSSVALQTPESGAECYVRHFPIPSEFTALSGRDEVLPVRTIDDDVAFSVHGELAVVKNGLKHVEVRSLEP